MTKLQPPYTDDPPLLLRPTTVARKLDVSRSTVYELMASGVLDSVVIRRSRRIPADSLTKFIDGLREAG